METMNTTENATPMFQPSELVEYGRIEEITQSGSAAVTSNEDGTDSYS